MINAKEFDVVLCDIALPDGNGYDVIVEAKRKGAVKAVAISGFAARDDIERGRELDSIPSGEAGGFHELRSVLGRSRCQPMFRFFQSTASLYCSIEKSYCVN